MSLLKTFACQMRSEMTPHEQAVWRLLRDGELRALNWRRQVVFGDYVLDFVSHPARLVVEVDGSQHSQAQQAEHDARRTAWLNSQGYRVRRIWNVEAVKERDGVWRMIHAAASETPAAMRMQRWREQEESARRSAIAHLPLDGGGGREAAGGGAYSEDKNGASGGSIAKVGGRHPLSHATRDSSPVEGERG